MSTTFTIHADKTVSDRFREDKWNNRPSGQWTDFLLPYNGQLNRLEGVTFSASQVRTVGGSSAFYEAADYAYSAHCPWVLTPDNVWLTCLLGLAHHVDSDPEGLRHHFVQHEGKVDLEFRDNRGVQDPTLWPDAIAYFSRKTKEHLGKKHDLIVNDFSTTRPVDKVASEVSLMGAMKHYFGYKTMLCCGLSQVTVEGTPDDWRNIHDRVRALSEFGLSWWTDHLLPVIDQIIAASTGKVDKDFWCRVYKRKGYGSGSQACVSGWLNAFFPYINGAGQTSQMAANKFLDWQGPGEGTDQQDFPFSLVAAPMKLDDNGTLYQTKLYGGLCGVSLDPKTMAVKAESGWCLQNLGRVKDWDDDPVLPEDATKNAAEQAYARLTGKPGRVKTAPAVTEPGRIPIRTELFVLGADGTQTKVTNFTVTGSPEEAVCNAKGLKKLELNK